VQKPPISKKLQTSRAINPRHVSFAARQCSIVNVPVSGRSPKHSAMYNHTQKMVRQYSERRRRRRRTTPEIAVDCVTESAERVRRAVSGGQSLPPTHPTEETHRQGVTFAPSAGAPASNPMRECCKVEFLLVYLRSRSVTHGGAYARQRLARENEQIVVCGPAI
jgi:hypothetical protein